MKKRKYFLLVLIVLFSTFSLINQYIKKLDADFVLAEGPNPGHSWDQMECSSDNICVDTLNNRVGIGTSSPSTKLQVSGILKVTGNIVDSSDNTIYNSTTQKIEAARLPFDQGDIVSDYTTSAWTSGYYNVANLIPANIKSGVSYGRNETGNFIPSFSCTKHTDQVNAYYSQYNTGTRTCGENEVIVNPLEWWQVYNLPNMSYLYIDGISDTCTDPSCLKLNFKFNCNQTYCLVGFSWWCCAVQ